jgi:predicted short-subunit dehydrogenase-like oxidoreductase (DUF2520 family)
MADRWIDPTEYPKEQAKTLPSVFIVGAGVVGTALATSMARAGIQVNGLHGRQAAQPEGAPRLPPSVATSSGEIPSILSQSDVVVIAVRDERVPEMAERLVRERRLGSHQVVFHNSGANSARSILAPVIPHVRAVGTFHPLVSFADPRSASEQFAEIAFAIEGDEHARAVGRQIAAALGARSIVIEPHDMALYHAGAVIAANYLVALADVARQLFVGAGVAPEEALPALIPLLQSTVRALAAGGSPGMLRGPVEWANVASTEERLALMKARAPEALPLYRLLGRHVLGLARRSAALDPDSASRLAELFED